jgi:hypothetical protein
MNRTFFSSIGGGSFLWGCRAAVSSRLERPVFHSKRSFLHFE